MTDDDARIAIEEVLQHLEAVSFVAHRDARAALPALERFDLPTRLYWLEAGRDLFFHDRDAGKAFLRNTPAMVEKTGTARAWIEQALAFTAWRGSWRALEGFMDQAGDVWQAWGEAGERHWYSLGRAWLERHMDSATAYFRTPFRQLGGARGLEGVRAVLAPAEALFAERRLALGSYLHGALRIRDLAGEAAIEDWARRGADILQAGRQRGEAYFRLDSEESMEMLLATLPGLRSREHLRLFQLLAWAWFGEELPMQDSGWRPDRGRAFVETDGRAVLLPAVMPDREQAVLGVIHACGHLTAGSYRRSAIEALFAEAGATHPPLAPDQPITWRPLFARYGEDMLRFQLLFDLCEDLRVDVAVNRRVPGHLQRLWRRATAQPMPGGAPGAYYALALKTLAGALGRQPLAPAFASLCRREAGIVDAFRIANDLYARTDLPPLDLRERDAAYLPGRSPNAARPVYPRRDAASDPEPDRDALAGEPGQRERQSEAREVPAGATGDDPDLNIPPEETAGAGGRVGVGIPQPATVIGLGQGHGIAQRGRPYPEWDYRSEAYKPDWAWVQERRLEERDPDGASRILAEQAGVLKRLRRSLQMQRPQRPAPQRRQMDGDELDLEATVEFVAERRLGRSPRAQVYRQRRQQQRDTAVLLLADLSTSVMARVGEDGGRVIDRLRAGLMLFAEALDNVGDPFAIAGFASKYRDNVSYYPVKRFDEPLNPHVRAAIAALSGRLATRMGAAIRHGLSEFRTRTTARRLLLILSDGRPSDYDDGGDERYLHEDTRMAVKEAQDAGVHPFCVTLDPRGGDYLPALFGPGHFLVLDRVDDLPRRLPEIYLRLRRR